MSSPRNLVYSRLLGLVVLAWAFAFFFLSWRVVRLASRFRALDSVSSSLVNLSARIAEIEARLDSFSSVESVSVPVDSPSSAPASGGAAWRVLGRGRLSKWEYLDVKHIDGSIMRYYSVLGDDASSSNVAARILADSREIESNLSMQETRRSPLVE